MEEDIVLMDEKDFEGSLVLEKLAEVAKLDDFFEAIDSDDFSKAVALMKEVQIDARIISIVKKKMATSSPQE